MGAIAMDGRYAIFGRILERLSPPATVRFFGKCGRPLDLWDRIHHRVGRRKWAGTRSSSPGRPRADDTL